MKIPVALALTLLLGGGVAVMVWVAGGWSWQAVERAGWLAAIAAVLLPAAGLWVWALRPDAQATGPQGGRRQQGEKWWSAPVFRVDPLRVGVHRSRHGLPPYVARDCDTQLAQRLDHAAVHGGLVLVVGPSTAGKTRAAWQAVATRFADRDVFVPDPGADLTRLADAVAARARGGGRSVVWLDDLDKYLNEGTSLTNSLLQQFHQAGAVVVATMRQGIHTRLTAPGPTARTPDGRELSVGEEERRLLRDTSVITVARQWSEAELDRAQASRDTAVARAARRQRDGRGHGVGEYLSSAPALYDLWQAQQELSASEGGYPRGHRVVAASVDLARIGVEHADRDLLEAAHNLYDLPDVLRPELFKQALDWAAQIHEDTCGLLLPATTGNPPTAWRPFDYLVDQTTTPIPDSLWRLALEHATNPATLTALGRAAYDHDRPDIAETAFRRAADSEHPRAMNGLGILLEERGEEAEAESWWRKAAEAGYTPAMNNLGLLLEQRGEVAEAESWWRKAAEEGHTPAMNNLGLLHEERREKTKIVRSWANTVIRDTNGLICSGILHEEPRENAAEVEERYRRATEKDRINTMFNLGLLHEEWGEVAEAESWWRRAAEAGHTGAMNNLAELCEKQGREVEAAEWLRRAAEAEGEG